MIFKWAIIIFVSVALSGVVVAWAAGLTVGGVDKLGSGSASVVEPDGVTLTKIQWVRKLENNVAKLVKVNTTFAKLPPGGDCGPGDGCTAHFVIKDVPMVLATNTVFPFELSTSSTTKITWDLVLLGQNIVGGDILGIDEFVVTVVDPES